MVDYPHASAACLCYLGEREGRRAKAAMLDVETFLSPSRTVHITLLAI